MNSLITYKHKGGWVQSPEYLSLLEDVCETVCRGAESGWSIEKTSRVLLTVRLYHEENNGATDSTNSNRWGRALRIAVVSLNGTRKARPLVEKITAELLRETRRKYIEHRKKHE